MKRYLSGGSPNPRCVCVCVCEWVEGGVSVLYSLLSDFTKISDLEGNKLRRVNINYSAQTTLAQKTSPIG